MSLLGRIKNTVRDSRTNQGVNRPILLFESVRSFMESHPVVQAMRVDARDVHSALVDYHQRKTSMTPPHWQWLRLPAQNARRASS